MANSEDIAHQKNLLSIHRRNLQLYLGQQAALGGMAYTPPGVANGILEARENIKRVKGILRGWGEAVDEHPDDVASPPAETPVQSAQGATPQIGRDQDNVHDSPGAITGSVSGGVTQNFGTQNTSNAGTVININGGDFRGSNLPIGNTVGRDLNQTVQGDIYNIARDLNMNANPSKDELLTALRQLKDELAKAKNLPTDEASDLKDNLNDAIEAAERPQPNKERTVKKLTAMQEILNGLKDNFASALALGHLIGQVLQAAQGLLF